MSAASPAPVSPAAVSLSPGTSADFGTRFSAFVIDALLLFSGQWIIFIVLSRQLQAVGLTTTEPCVAGGVTLCEGPNTALWILLLGLYVVTTIGYHAVFEGRYGATPGKRVMGLCVTGSNGQSPIGMSAGLLRSIVRQLFWLTPLFLFDVSPLSLGLPSILFAMLPALTLIVFVLGAFRVDGRAGHDLAARTRVVRNAPNSTPHDAPTLAVTDAFSGEGTVTATTEPYARREPAMSGIPAPPRIDAQSSVESPFSPADDDDIAADDPEESV